MYKRVGLTDLPVLSEKQQNVLITRIKTGDLEARNEFIIGNLRMVAHITNSFANRCQDNDEIFQEGCIGLIDAVDRFDPSFELKFSTFAYWYIIGKIKLFLNNDNPMKLSRGVQDALRACFIFKDKLFMELGREPSYIEIAERGGVSPASVLDALAVLTRPMMPLDYELSDDLTLWDIIWDTNLETEEDICANLDLNNALSLLTVSEKDLLDLYYKNEISQHGIAKRLGISQAQVSRKLKNIHNKLRIYLSMHDSYVIKQ